MKKALYVLILSLLVSSIAFADGGGGMFLGRQRVGYPFFEDLKVPNNSLGLTYYGGYGYGVSSGNAITGGFGVAVVDHEGNSGIGGGFGGIMNGVRLFRRPLSVQIINCTGVGGVSTGTGDDDGFFGFYDELTLELGLPLTGWFMPVVYVGYQVIGQLTFGDSLVELFSYTPVIGLRIGWGDFR